MSHRFVTITAAVFISAAAISASAQAPVPIEERVKRLETLLSSGTLIELLDRVESLQAEVQSLRGEVEEQTHAVSQLNKRQRELYLDVDRRLSNIETMAVAAPESTDPAIPAAGTNTVGDGDTASTGVTVAAADTTPADSATEAVSGTDTSTAVAAADPVDAIREQDAYQTAFTLLKTGRYEEAGDAFRTFLDDYSTGKYADNAQYWLGETYYVRQRFAEAVQQFRVLAQRYPDSAKFPHALLKIGYSQSELGQNAAAEQTFNELIARFPQSPAARNAEKRLERMRADTG